MNPPLPRAAPRRDEWGGGGGRRPFKVDSFHAPPIGIMLTLAPLGGGAKGPLCFFLQIAPEVLVISL